MAEMFNIRYTERKTGDTGLVTHPVNPHETWTGDYDAAEIYAAALSASLGKRYSYRIVTEDVLEQVADLIWTTSRADEGTISATGAKHIARALAGAGFIRRTDVTRTMELP